MDVTNPDRQDVQTLLARVGLVPRGTVSRATFRRRAPHRAKRGVSRECSRCGAERRDHQRYCRQCHAAYARATRPKHSALSPEARRRANCRRLTGMLVARGKMAKTPCTCGATDVTAVQLGDYSDPWDVAWKCRACRMPRRIAVEAA